MMVWSGAIKQEWEDLKERGVAQGKASQRWCKYFLHDHSVWLKDLTDIIAKS